MRLTVEERKEVAKQIFTALNAVKGDKLVNVTATCIKDEYCIELTLDKVLRNAVNRAQIWVCATRIDIWYGRLFASAFDGDNNTLFTSNEFLDKRTVKCVKQDIRTGDIITATYKERLVRYNSIDEFIPVVLDNIVNIAQGAQGVNLDNILDAIMQASNKAQESVKDAGSIKDNAQAQDKPKTQSRRKKDADKATKGDKTQTVEKKPRQKKDKAQ